MKRHKTLLCVDDQQFIRQLITEAFQDLEFEVHAKAAPEEGLETARTTNFDAIILDYQMSGMNGAELCCEIRKFNQQTPIVFFTGSEALTDEKALAKIGAQALLRKPTDLFKLIETVKELTA